MAGKRKYIDLRYMFMRGLMSHEQMQRGRSYLKSAAECTSKAIVSLELSDKNINTTKQAMRLESIGHETVRRLEGYVDSKAYSSDQPAPGCFVTSAGALLVALLNLTEMAAESIQSGVALIKEDELRNEAAKLSEEKILPKDSPGFCQAWWRLEVLIKRDLVKRRSLHKANVYHLLPLGMEAAVMLRARSLRQSVLEAAKTSPAEKKTAIAKNARRRKAEEVAIPDLSSVKKKISAPGVSALKYSISMSDRSVLSTASSSVAPAASAEKPKKPGLTDAMYSNDTGADGVVLLVDIQECGGNRNGLAELCEMIEQTGTVYKTRKLPSADYTWIWRCEDVDKYLPVLLERKRADDVAYSLKDGRFWRQISKMTAQKEEFQKKGVAATLLYVVEGKPENFVVHCADGCLGVGQCGNPTLTQVKRVLTDLQQHPHLKLVAMDSILDTVRLLADLTLQLKNRCERGDFDTLLVAELTPTATAAKKTTRGEGSSVTCCSKADQAIIIDDDEDDEKAAIRSDEMSLEERCSNRQLHWEANHEGPWLSRMKNRESAQMLGNGKHWLDSGDSGLGKIAKEKDMEAGISTRNSNSVWWVEEDSNGSPPLLLPSLAKARRTFVYEESRLVGQDGREERERDREVPVRSKGRPVIPREHVYLMKHSPVKSGMHPTPTRQNLAHQFPGKYDLTSSPPPATCSSPAKNNEVRTWQGRKNTYGVHQSAALSANFSPSTKNNCATCSLDKHCLSCNSPDRCSFTVCNSPDEYHMVCNSPDKHYLTCNSPDKYSLTCSFPGKSNRVTHSTRKDSDSSGVCKAETKSVQECAYKDQVENSLIISVPGDSDYEDDLSLPELQPLEPKPLLSSSSGEDTVSGNCPSLDKSGNSNHSGWPVSHGSGKSSPHESFDLSVKQGWNAANEACSSAILCSAAVSTTESTTSDVSSSVSDSSMVTTIARLNSSLSSKSMIFSLPDKSIEAATRKPWQPTQEDTTVSLVSERLSSITQPLQDSFDGSDSEDSNSLPDIDLTLPPVRSPSLSSALSIPLQPSHSITSPGETQGREATPCHWGSNSQEETTAQVLNGPENETASNEAADKIAQIATVFPQMSRNRIVEVLHDFGEDVERCVIAILKDPGLIGSREMVTVSPTSTITAVSVSSMTSSAHCWASGGISNFIDLTD